MKLTTQGILWKIVHGITMACISAIAKYMSLQGIPVSQILTIEMWLAIPPIMILAVLTKTNIFKASQHFLMISRGVLGGISLILYYLALKVVPLPTAIAIGFSGPLLTTIFAISILKEKTTKKRLISLVVGFLGVLLIVQPGLNGFQAGSLLVLAVVVIWCVIDLIIKRLGNTEKTLTQTFWITGIIALGSLPFAVLQWQPMTPQLWGFGLLIGLIFCVNTCAVFMSYRATDLTLVIPFRTIQLIFATLLGALFFNEYLDILTLVGSLVVLGSAFYLYKFKDEV